MSFHPKFYHLGQLEMLEVYDVYDRPVLFSCKNPAGAYYLVVLIEDSPEDDIWLYVETSLSRLNAVRTGTIDLYTAFIDAETQSVWEVKIPRDETLHVECIARPVTTLTYMDLPMPGEYLNLSAHTAPILPNNIVQHAKQTHRDIARFKFEFLATVRTEAPVKGIGKIFVAIQDFVHGLASYVRPNFNGRISDNIPPKHQLVYEAAGAGSFEVQFASLEGTDMLDNSWMSLALAELMDIIEIGTDDEKLQEKLSSLKSNIVGRYLEFLKELREYVTSTTITWASPSGNIREVSLPQPTVDKTIDIIQISNPSDERTDVIRGVLVGANLERRRFELKVKEDRRSRSIRGKVSDNGMKDLEYAQLSIEYTATIKYITTLKTITGEQFESCELESLKRSDSIKDVPENL
ncbi:MAG: hypothetical protein LCH85_22145 [Chloroflexi bacterium]|nr:hypothetical protein [Chloroflexota bacterium]